MGRKDELPPPFVRRFRILAVQRIREFNVAVAACKISFVERSYADEMILQWLDDRTRKHGDPVLAAFAVPHADLSVIEIVKVVADYFTIHDVSIYKEDADVMITRATPQAIMVTKAVWLAMFIRFPGVMKTGFATVKPTSRAANAM